MTQLVNGPKNPGQKVPTVPILEALRDKDPAALRPLGLAILEANKVPNGKKFDSRKDDDQASLVANGEGNLFVITNWPYPLPNGKRRYHPDYNDFADQLDPQKNKGESLWLRGPAFDQNPPQSFTLSGVNPSYNQDRQFDPRQSVTRFITEFVDRKLAQQRRADISDEAVTLTWQNEWLA